jgi:hypothetical protein
VEQHFSAGSTEAVVVCDHSRAAYSYDFRRFEQVRDLTTV